jgi:CBS domain-containing protein
MSRAHAQMIQRGVRLLFVLERDSGIVGVITATDILGEKPLRFAQSHGVTHAEIVVSDVMTPASMLEAIPVQDVAQMRVGHIVATHKAVRRQHLMVVEDNGRRVRGLFSLSQVARQLGIPLQTTQVAQTFADIEAALVR